MKLIMENWKRFLKEEEENSSRLTEDFGLPMDAADSQGGSEEFQSHPREASDIGKAATLVGAMQQQDGFLFYTINNKRPRSPSDIGQLAKPGAKLKHFFKKGVDINAMAGIINSAQSNKNIELQKDPSRMGPDTSRAFFLAGLVFHIGVDRENNAVDLLVARAAEPIQTDRGPSISDAIPKSIQRND